MGTTKKIIKIYTQMEMKRESKQHTRKTQLTKKLLEEIRNKKGIRYTDNKQEKYKSPFCHNYFKCKWVKFSSTKAEIGIMGSKTGSKYMWFMRNSLYVQRHMLIEVKDVKRHSMQIVTRRRLGQLYEYQPNNKSKLL